MSVSIGNYLKDADHTKKQLKLTLSALANISANVTISVGDNVVAALGGGGLAGGVDFFSGTSQSSPKVAHPALEESKTNRFQISSESGARHLVIRTAIKTAV